MPSSRGPSQPRDQIHGSYVSCTGKQVLYLYGHLLSKTANDSGPKSMFETTSNLPKFWVKVKAEYPGIVTNALKSLLPLPTSYLCEAGFSAVTTRKMRLSVTVSHYPQMVTSNCRKTSSGLPLILCYGELYTYFIISHNVIIIEIKYINKRNVLESSWNHPPSLAHGKILPWNHSLMLKRLGMAGMQDPCVDSSFSSWNGHSVVTGTQRFLSPPTFITWVENYTAEWSSHRDSYTPSNTLCTSTMFPNLHSSHASIRIKFHILVKNCFTASHRQIVNFLLYRETWPS